MGTGLQGVMTSQSKNLLTKYLLNNDSFIIEKEWTIPDKSKLILLRRKELNTTLLKKDCNLKTSNIKIKQINNGLNIYLILDGRSLESSSLLIDIKGKDFNKSVNVSLANGFFHNSLNKQICYELSQNISVDFPKEISKNLFITAKLLNKKGQTKYLNVSNDFILEENLFNNKIVQMTNRIEKVENLGSYLREGEFKNLFDLVGIINQSDPKQKYLEDSEMIYIQRFKENNKLKDLYSILISQILQRKIIQANETINLILKYDNNNGNAYLTKAILNLYLFDSKGARSSINKSKELQISQEGHEYLNIIEGLNYLLEMKFINAYNAFT